MTWLCILAGELEFLSTPSVGRATAAFSCRSAASSISIHALRGEGDQVGRPDLLGEQYFYPRPPWGGRPQYASNRSVMWLFLSTPSVGRATKGSGVQQHIMHISIHALRGEGDHANLGQVVALVGISIHALRGEGDC